VDRWQGAPAPQTLTWPGANKMGHATVWATCLRLKAFCGDARRRQSVLGVQVQVQVQRSGQELCR